VEHFRDADCRREAAERQARDLALEALRAARRGNLAAAWELYADRSAVKQEAQQQWARRSGLARWQQFRCALD
jgi:hypothetical protein